MKLVLVTGAGASCNLSNSDDRPLPVMKDWADRLCTDLGPELSAMTRLDAAQTGTDFEETLGALLRWGDMLETIDRFAGMTRPPKGRGDQRHDERTRTAFRQARANFRAVTDTLHKSLFAEFGPDRLSPEACESAYKSLFDRLVPAGANLGGDVVCATTNYDRSLEVAIDRIGYEPEVGIQAHQFMTPTLDPKGLGKFGSGSPSVVYLHGAVGWYLNEQHAITAQSAQAGYVPGLGRPAVLYPDPDKEIERTETAELWEEFKQALAAATHMLVIGHSLNDPHLVEELNRASQSGSTRLGYVVHADASLAISEEQVDYVRQALPEAVAIPGIFGPDPVFEDTAWTVWSQ